jgi:Transposase DDE domain
LTHLTELARTMQDLLTIKADPLASQCGFVKRKRKVTGANFAQTVVFTAMADSDAPGSRCQVIAAAVGLNASRQALDKQFNARGAEFLRELLRVAVTEMVATPAALPLLQRFTAVEVLDRSVVALPDELADIYRGGRSGRGPTTGPKASVKLTVGLDLESGALREPESSAGRAGDLKAPLAEAAPPAGGLQLADLNYFDLKKFARWQGGGAYWLSRLKSGPKVHDERGRRIDRVAFLRAAGTADVDVNILLGGEQRLACRLIAQRVPSEVADLRRRRLLDKCTDRGNRPSALSLALCDWTILVTNVLRELLSVEEAVALARMRWQIELIFKLWKSRGGIDEYRSSKPQSALREVYGTLLAQVVRHWVIVVGAWSQRDRSLTKAAEIVTLLAMSLASAMRCVHRLRGVLSYARELMAIAARMEKHGASPNAHDVIFCLDTGP